MSHGTLGKLVPNLPHPQLILNAHRLLDFFPNGRTFIERQVDALETYDDLTRLAMEEPCRYTQEALFVAFFARMRARGRPETTAAMRSSGRTRRGSGTPTRRMGSTSTGSSSGSGSVASPSRSTSTARTSRTASDGCCGGRGETPRESSRT